MKLLDEGPSDLKIGSPGVEELESLQHAPAVLSHEVGSKNGRGSTLTSHRVYKNRFILFDGILNEVINCFRRGVLDVKDDLVL